MRFLTKAFLTSAALNLTAAHFAGAAPAPGGPLLQQNFNGPTAWSSLAATIAPAASGVRVTAAHGPVGTIDAADSTTPSGAVRLTVDHPAANGRAWSAALTSGLLPVHTAETDLGKLTLSFDHSVSSVRPVTVRIESFDARRRRTGGREGAVYPAAPDFYLRAALELSTMHPFGAGAFRPTDPFVRLTFQIARLPAGAVEETQTELRVDNVAYASPAYYVSPSGSDADDGRTEKTAFADPQKAVDAAQPGDVILLMDGIYARHDDIGFRRGGTPAAWITLKNYPGQHPILTSDSWNVIKIGRGRNGSPTAEPALAYIELRGLHVRGNALVAKERFPQDVGKVLSDTNGNGISIDGRYETNVIHHVRIADTLVEDCCGGGIGAGEADWVTAENDVSRDNCWWTIYACSGISFLSTSNFDAADNVYKDLIRNNVTSGNRCYVKWGKVNKISDGNGIIIDSNYEPQKDKVHRGRTLIQNNLSFNNGGSGIHSYHSHRVDIVNNTAYYNGASPELRWGQIFVQEGDDARILNNVLVSRPGQPINSVGPDGGDQNSTKIVRANNVYFGGLPPKFTGDNDVFADPQFVNASTDSATADFHVRPGSPALKSGWQGALVPLLDLDGKHRPMAAAPDRGAYQH